MDHIRNIVTEVERALGKGATPSQVEAVAELVLERIDRSRARPGIDKPLDTSEYAVVTVAGPNGNAILALVSNVLSDCGAIVEDVSQTARHGVFALAIRANLSGVDISLLELRKRLQSAASGQDARVSVHRADLYTAMTKV